MIDSPRYCHENQIIYLLKFIDSIEQSWSLINEYSFNCIKLDDQSVRCLTILIISRRNNRKFELLHFRRYLFYITVITDSLSFDFKITEDDSSHRRVAPFGSTNTWQISLNSTRILISTRFQQKSQWNMTLNKKK